MDPALIWFLIGVTLFVAEFIAPGVVIVFFSMGAFLTALTTLCGLTNSLSVQVMVFTITTFILLFVLRSTLKKWFIGEEDTESPKDEFIGKQVNVIESIPGGAKRGKVEHKGSNWNARSDSKCEKGDLVEIVEIDGLTLTVKPLN